MELFRSWYLFPFRQEKEKRLLKKRKVLLFIHRLLGKKKKIHSACKFPPKNYNVDIYTVLLTSVVDFVKRQIWKPVFEKWLNSLRILIWSNSLKFLLKLKFKQQNSRMLKLIVHLEQHRIKNHYDVVNWNYVIPI